MSIDKLIDTVGDLGDIPDMVHPEYGIIRKDGEVTQAGLDYFEDEKEKLDLPNVVGNC